MDLEKKAIERIKVASEMSLHHYGLPLVCTYSGGKDSDVLLELFRRSGVPFEVIHSHTTVDAPPTVYHVREKFRELELEGIKATISMPVYKGERTDMWKLIVNMQIPPTRTRRYCCKVLKEQDGGNRFIATGVRWDESSARAGRRTYETMAKTKKDSHFLSDEIMLLSDNDEKRILTEWCTKQNKAVVNPIIEWANSDIWDYINSESIEHNPLYHHGYRRVGCVGCPMAGKARWKEFRDFPAYRMAYIQTFNKMLDAPKYAGSRWHTGVDVFLWWMEDQNVEGQMSISDYLEGGEV